MVLWFGGLMVVLVLCFCASCGGRDSAPMGATVLRAADFGARPDDGEDDGPAVQAMIAAAREIEGPAVIQFEAGRYDFFATTASKARYPVTAVQLQWDFVTPLHLDSASGLTIDGGGATFVMHGRMTPFVLNHCDGVTVRGAAIEHERPSVFELKVLAVGEDWLDLEPAAGDRYVIEGGSLIWLDADDQRQEANVFQIYDPLLDTVRRCGDPLAGAEAIELEGDGRLRVRYQPGAEALQQVRQGQTLQFRWGTRKQSGAVIFDCRDVTFEDMDIHSWNGLGFVGQFSHNVTLRNLRMQPSAESGRTNAGHADGVQMMNCRGRLVIEGCRIVGLHDDHINIYGQLMQVAAVEAPRTVRAIYTCRETQGHVNFRPGDVIGFRDAATMADLGEGKVAAAELLDQQTMRIEVEGLPADIPPEAWAENRTWIPDEVVIRDNYFGRVPTRSILMYLSRKAVIENNVFHRIRMQAILIQCPDFRWALQNHAGELTIRDNVFVECLSDIVRCAPQVEQLSPHSNMYGELRFADNLIIRREGDVSLLNVRGFQTVRVGENRIETAESRRIEAQLLDCGSADLADQRILGAAGVLKLECQRVDQLSASAWQVD